MEREHYTIEVLDDGLQNAERAALLAAFPELARASLAQLGALASGIGQDVKITLRAWYDHLADPAPTQQQIDATALLRERLGELLARDQITIATQGEHAFLVSIAGRRFVAS